MGCSDFQCPLLTGCTASVSDWLIRQFPLSSSITCICGCISFSSKLIYSVRWFFTLTRKRSRLILGLKKGSSFFSIGIHTNKLLPTAQFFTVVNSVHASLTCAGLQLIKVSFLHLRIILKYPKICPFPVRVPFFLFYKSTIWFRCHLRRIFLLIFSMSN